SPPTGTPATTLKGLTRALRSDCARLISCCMSLLATRRAVGLLISTLGLTKTGELTADSLTVKFPNWTPPRSYSVCANQRLSRDCSFVISQYPFFTIMGFFALSVYHNFVSVGTFVL